MFSSIFFNFSHTKKKLKKKLPGLDSIKYLKMTSIKEKKSLSYIGKESKYRGHKIEEEFFKSFCCIKCSFKTTYSSSSDNYIKNYNPIYYNLLEKLNLEDKKVLNVSTKSGKNIQFVLGNIPELYKEPLKFLKDKSNVLKILRKYLKKELSNSPADMLVYKDIDEDKWLFFKMDDIIDFIAEKCSWRLLESGRLKGDFLDFSKKGKRQYITYEYRASHKSYFLGLNGNKGKEFIKLLIYNNINHFEI